MCTFRNKTRTPLHSVVACTAHKRGDELIAHALKSLPLGKDDSSLFGRFVSPERGSSQMRPKYWPGRSRSPWIVIVSAPASLIGNSLSSVTE